MALIVDDEFKGLIPSLSAEEYEQLEKSILAEGMREKIIVWKNIIIDGHARYGIALKHTVTFCAVEKQFSSREEAKEFIILNQFGRRNLTPYQRSILALRLKPVLEEKAKERMLSGKELNPEQKSEQGKTADNLAKIAGVSRDTIYKVELIENKAPEDIKEKLHEGLITINKAYQETKQLIEPKAEISIGLVEAAVDVVPEFDEYKYFCIDVAEKFMSSIFAVLELQPEEEHLKALTCDLRNDFTIEKKLEYINLAMERLETIKMYLNNNKPK